MSQTSDWKQQTEAAAERGREGIAAEAFANVIQISCGHFIPAI